MGLLPGSRWFSSAHQLGIPIKCNLCFLFSFQDTNNCKEEHASDLSNSLPNHFDTEPVENDSLIVIKKRGRPRTRFSIELNNHSTPVVKEAIKPNSDLPKKRGRPRKAPRGFRKKEVNGTAPDSTPIANAETDSFADDESENNEEDIEIVFEDISSHDFSAQAAEPPSDQHIPPSEQEEPKKIESSEKSVEATETCGQQDAARDEPMEVVKEAASERLDIEDEVSIVYFDESESVLSGSGGSEKVKILIGTDSDTDSTVVDLSEYNNRQTTRFMEFENENSNQEDSNQEDSNQENSNQETVEELESDMKKINIEDSLKLVQGKTNGMLHSLYSDSEAEDLDSRSQESDAEPATMVEATEQAAELDESSAVRRSRRIKKISSKKKRSVGHGLVRDRDKCRPPDEIDDKIVEPSKTQEEIDAELQQKKDTDERLKKFIDIKENEYKCDRNVSKDAKRMLCDCFLTEEEIRRGELGCGEDCLNRLLMIECGPKCNVGTRCTNQRFQKKEYADCSVFRTEKKGFGVSAAQPIQPGEFIMEYVGEVLDSDQFEKRATEYSKERNLHYYFMALRSDAIIDATTRGNISRFINHSCDPNAETQKWTVNGELRIGFFSKRFIPVGEELTFDYQFQRYG